MQIFEWNSPPHNLKAPDNHVDIWAMNVGDFSSRIGELSNILTAHELKKANAFHFPEDRNRYIISHSLLRLVLGSYSNISVDNIAFQTNSYGKPGLLRPSGLGLYFNISHSRDGVLMAFSQAGEVGVDIEVIRSVVTGEEIVQRYFSQPEIEAFNQYKGPDRDQFFYILWTRKEAFIKAVGKGLSYSLDTFSVTAEGPQIHQWSRVSAAVVDSATWYVKSLKMSHPYCAAVAVRDQPLPVYCWKIWDLDRFDR